MVTNCLDLDKCSLLSHFLEYKMKCLIGLEFSFPHIKILTNYGIFRIFKEVIINYFYEGTEFEVGVRGVLET